MISLLQVKKQLYEVLRVKALRRMPLGERFYVASDIIKTAPQCVTLTSGTDSLPADGISN